MISINGNIINRVLFSDGTQRMSNIIKHIPCYEATIYWKYESEDELIAIQYLTMYLRDNKPGITIKLIMPYVPNARMDRVESMDEVFTLKYFSRIINSLNFYDVTMLDTHSRVTDALIDRAVIISPDIFIENTKHEILKHERTYQPTIGNVHYVYECFKNEDKFIYFFPDKGAYDKYKKLKSVNSQCSGILYGEKYRNWETCEIEKFEIRNTEQNGESLNRDIPVLIIDDIISSGNTIVKSVNELNALGYNNIYVYCTHLENRFNTDEQNTLRNLLETGKIKKLFTTNSLYKEMEQNNEKVHVFNFRQP